MWITEAIWEAPAGDMGVHTQACAKTDDVEPTRLNNDIGFEFMYIYNILYTMISITTSPYFLLVQFLYLY